MDVIVIIAVGSSKDMILKALGFAKEDEENVIDFASREKDKDIRDVDLFIITNEDERKQLRQVKNTEGIEFDLNYFPEKVAKAMLEKKMQFFLEEVSVGRVIYDPEGKAREYIEHGRQIYDQGPPEASKGNLAYLKYNLKSKLDSIVSRKAEDDDFEFEFVFLAGQWLKNLLAYYFKIKGVWIPKDEKILEVLKEQDQVLYDKVKDFYEKKDTETLKDIARYVFYEDGVKLGDEMRFKFKF